MRLIGVIFVAVILLASCGHTATKDKAIHSNPGQHEEVLIHDGIRRSYILYIPPQYNSQTSIPLVLLFHGGGGNAKQALDYYGMVEKADQEGFILVAPNGTGRFTNKFLTWNVKFGFGHAMKKNIDDIGFVERIIDNLESRLKIDPKRIFATGISNGGFLCHFLAANLSDKIAAIAPIVASVGGKKRADEEYILPPFPKHPVSVIAFNGLIDEHIPYSGGIQKKSVGNLIYVTSAEQMHSFWTKANQCTPKPQIEKQNKYEKIRYSQGFNNSEVIQYLIYDHGHAWPGGKKPRRRADTPSKAINATDVMWEFFKNHPKNKPNN